MVLIGFVETSLEFVACAFLYRIDVIFDHVFPQKPKAQTGGAFTQIDRTTQIENIRNVFEFDLSPS